jgi:hypothetical protein
MKTYLSSLLVFLVFTLFTNCSNSIKTIVDRNELKQPFKNPLMVILYNPEITKNFCVKLKERFEVYLQQDSKKADFILVKIHKKELALNETDSTNIKIDQSIQNNNTDVVIIFKPTHYTFDNGGLGEISYLITAIDVKSKKEVWKATLTSTSSFGMNGVTEKTATLVYGRLVGEAVI